MGSNTSSSTTSAGNSNGGSAIQGLMTAGNAISSISSSVFQMCEGIAGYVYQGEIIEIQKEMQLSALNHNKEMEKISMEDQLNALENNEKKLAMQESMFKIGLEQKRELRAQELKGKELEAAIVEQKLTAKQSAISKTALRAMFCNYRGQNPMRNERSRGTPTAR
ncbi:MAG TPA: hypothetical protein PK712_06760 [Rectinema sp.]|nr:hypothetical protein [Rectinema sp.]